MMYPFLILDDETEIVHSELKEDGEVEVYIEKPDEKLGFRSAECWLPSYSWRNVNGFSENDLKSYQDILESTAHLIMEFARHGGFENASGF